MYNLENVNIENLKLYNQEKTNFEHFSKEKKHAKKSSRNESVKKVRKIKSILLDIEAFQNILKSEEGSLEEAKFFLKICFEKFLKLYSEDNIFKKNELIYKDWDIFFKGETDEITLKITDFQEMLESKIKQLSLRFEKPRKTIFQERTFEKIIERASLSKIESYLEIIGVMIKEAEKFSLRKN